MRTDKRQRCTGRTRGEKKKVFFTLSVQKQIHKCTTTSRDFGTGPRRARPRVTNIGNAQGAWKVDEKKIKKFIIRSDCRKSSS